MLGAFISDAAGAPRECQRGDCPDELIEHAMSLPGGGFTDLAPGQITDDTEMSMCQLRALMAG